MPQMATITMNGIDHSDGVTTVVRTLSRELTLPDGVQLRETGATAAELAEAGVAKFRTKTAASGGALSRLQFSFSKPYVANAATGLMRFATVSLDFVIPGDCPLAVRKDIKAALSGYTGGVSITNWVEDRDNPT